MKVHTLYTCTVKKSLKIWANTVQDKTICETVCSTVFRHCFKVIYTFLLVFTCCTELVFSWWHSQTWTWSSWPAWKMVELTSLNMVVDRLDVHACWNRLFMAWWTNRLEQRCWNHHDKSTAMFMHDRTCCHWMIKFQIEQRCYNNRELDCCIKSGFACANKREQPLSIPQAVYNMLNYMYDSTILLFYQSCSIMLTVLLQGCWVNNPVIFLHVYTQRYSYLG